LAVSESPWRDSPVVVRAPATSANLGPGFDSLGLALSVHDITVARVIMGGLEIEAKGEASGTAGDGEGHLVVRAMRAAFDVLGGQPPGIGLRALGSIPHGRGLGSSAAAIVTGVLAARGLARDGAELLPDAAVLNLAASIEGHPDNVAACLAGGLTIAWTGLSGLRMVRLPVLEQIRPVVCVPFEVLATATARQVLPDLVPHGDAAANSARSALLVAAMTRAPEMLFDATEDYVHQRYRAAVMPDTTDLLTRLRAAGVPAVVSGAGPSVLALTVPGQGHGPDLVDSIAREMGIGWRVSPLDIDRRGATFQIPVPDERPRDTAL
jgi:homoserine kinase